MKQACQSKDTTSIVPQLCFSPHENGFYFMKFFFFLFSFSFFASLYFTLLTSFLSFRFLILPLFTFTFISYHPFFPPYLPLVYMCVCI
ncbi:serine/threonine-protein kinase hal4 [Histoplasma capsulatum G186AR]|uniref:Serine/threonine-protein kinase hal4 n=1 Tax=Ajellomyces capsulatus TaxID=5037 RepID=A0A8H8CU12_AJECA|nr:serine/threonine-protein kinase hal4 [Histoplasma capsulatum]QSS72569.1 serine/threonine-protein kinase hal4 [Histoplasma capsulatum G186AR]